ncbi:AEC family transporter [Secundilactobacillus silagei]|uniref:AEC family transporter n=1 Tax=Secundilactobacillus silagei TaxID=1293415 RepID=UPI002091E70C|nr:AEC family transporter [Secundilactobacillus silagei]
MSDHPDRDDAGHHRVRQAVFPQTGADADSLRLIFANLGFIGLPLSKAVLGTGSVFYMSIFVGVSNFSLWTYGIYMISGDKRTIQLKRLVVNPAILALVFGLLFALTGVTLPPILGKTVSDLAT